jgi:prepilin-type N-terminal cleavage/methylation domain-containing protein
VRLNSYSESASKAGLRASVGISRGAFTLIELILVMAILTIAVSITAPALANFFRGRTLDSEARRLLALTRHGQSRAVSEGIPMELWLDTAQGTFGLEAQPSYETEDGKAVELRMDSDIQLQVLNNKVPTTAGLSGTIAAAGPAGTSPLVSRHPDVPKIQFLPDGSMSDTSPQALVLTGRDGMSLCLQQARNRLSYEIRPRTN